MLLVIDVGNTRIKAAVFENNTRLIAVAFGQDDAGKQLQRLFHQFQQIQAIVTSSVTNYIPTTIQDLGKEIPIYQISQHTKFPFINQYATPNTLGIDRMVLAAGAVLQFPNQDRLVIDAGTCITYDYITADNVYLGGAIAPGIHMRYNALHDYTAKLPLLTPQYPKQTIGNSTQESIHVGVVQGVLHEIESTITAFTTSSKSFSIILTGGDTEFLAKRLKNTIFANSNFLLESLYYTYQYHIQNAY
ncbi:MAG: type III pantothenate kinase [Flavobacterium sp.]|nr:type III pantothenate kinase [Flavobacterium sp.]